MNIHLYCHYNERSFIILSSMSPRPRTVTDETILTAAYRAMARLGPVRLTLADVAKEAGLSAATLVQRFGSKRGLLLAASASAVGGVDACFAALRVAHRSPLSALISAATEMTRLTASPEEMANHLAFLQIDLSDPEFHAHTLEMTRRMEDGYRALLDDAVDAGELVACDTRRLARAIGAVAGGSIIGTMGARRSRDDDRSVSGSEGWQAVAGDRDAPGGGPAR